MGILELRELGTTALLKYVTVLCISYYVFSSIVAWYKLRHFAGPFLCKFSHIWSIYHQYAKDVGPAHLKLSKYNYPLVRTGPHYLVTTDPNIFKHVNGARSTYQRDPLWAAGRIDYYRPSLVDTLDVASHDKKKAKVAGGYSGARSTWRESSTGKSPISLTRFFTLDVITRLSYGKEFGWVKADEDLYGYGSEISKAAVMGAFAEIKSAVSSGKVSIPITLVQAQSLPYLQFGYQHPELHGRHNALTCIPTPHTGCDLGRFPYATRRNVRHYKVVPPGGDTIAGMWVPGGTAIGHCHYGMMRNKQIFGDDVEVFRPERYQDEPNGEEMQRTVELVFGTGRWMCVGKQVALMELNKIFWEVSRLIITAPGEEMITIFG
ncbi:cytochrome P450 [Aspergillus alliaceus]|uniref:cytochrome P450 n=1 Tax=Petromyces alliaceus TaxID=209559 RepID=UPI0012A5F71E|nr:cytochrome P450 [Aspergillus alliaceus]KAB8228303.1 cytochrome P450 [Aspergillus alliaceus]